MKWRLIHALVLAFVLVPATRAADTFIVNLVVTGPDLELRDAATKFLTSELERIPDVRVTTKDDDANIFLQVVARPLKLHDQPVAFVLGVAHGLVANMFFELEDGSCNSASGSRSVHHLVMVYPYTGIAKDLRNTCAQVVQDLNGLELMESRRQRSAAPSR